MKTYVRRRKGESPSSNVILHLNELCRLCLAKEEEMMPIYDEDAVPLPLRIMACLNLEVRSQRLFCLNHFIFFPFRSRKLAFSLSLSSSSPSLSLVRCVYLPLLLLIMRAFGCFGCSRERVSCFFAPKYIVGGGGGGGFAGNYC